MEKGPLGKQIEAERKAREFLTGCKAPYCWSEYGTPCGECEAVEMDSWTEYTDEGINIHITAKVDQPIEFINVTISKAENYQCVQCGHRMTSEPLSKCTRCASI